MMMDTFIVAAPYGVHVQCLRHGYKKENLACHSLFLKQGDILTIRNRKKYIVDVGWFVLVRINDLQEEFILADELENAMQNQWILNEIDCFLKLCSVSYYVDQALACRNKEEFIQLTAARNELAQLYAQLSGSMLVGS